MRITSNTVAPLSIINSCLLLILIWAVMGKTFASDAFTMVPPASLVAVLFLDLAVFGTACAAAFGGARAVNLVSRRCRNADTASSSSSSSPSHGETFTKRDTASIVLCGATKTVALGIPMINVIFEGSASIGVISLPLLIYHAEQLVGTLCSGRVDVYSWTANCRGAGKVDLQGRSGR